MQTWLATPVWLNSTPCNVIDSRLETTQVAKCWLLPLETTLTLPYQNFWTFWSTNREVQNIFTEGCEIRAKHKTCWRSKEFVTLWGWGLLRKTLKRSMRGFRKLTFEIMVRVGVPEGCWESAVTPSGSSETGSSEPASAHYSLGPAGSSCSFTVMTQDTRKKDSRHLIIFQLFFFSFEMEPWLLSGRGFFMSKQHHLPSGPS